MGVRYPAQGSLAPDIATAEIQDDAVTDAKIASHTSTKITGLPTQTQALDMGSKDITAISKVVITATQPRFILEESDQADNTKKWAFQLDNSTFSIVSINDAENTQIKAIQINRDSGSNEIDKIRFKTAAGVARLIITDPLADFSTVDLSIDAGKKIFLDGGNDTSIDEVSADRIRLTAGGQRGLLIDEVGGEVNIICGISGALATDATNGFLYIPTSAGAPTGTPTAKTGKVALEFDTTNNDLYVYDGSWKKVALA